MYIILFRRCLWMCTGHFGLSFLMCIGLFGPSTETCRPQKRLTHKRSIQNSLVGTLLRYVGLF